MVSKNKLFPNACFILNALLGFCVLDNFQEGIYNSAVKSFHKQLLMEVK